MPAIIPWESVSFEADDALVKRQNPGVALGAATGHGSGPNKALAIALGVGIPIILAIGGLIWWFRRKKARETAGKPPKTTWGTRRKGAVPKKKKTTPMPATVNGTLSRPPQAYGPGKDSNSDDAWEKPPG